MSKTVKCATCEDTGWVRLIGYPGAAAACDDCNPKGERPMACACHADGPRAA